MNHDPIRVRKLLLHKKEINRLLGKTQQKGLTLVPLRIYFSKRGQAKVELGLAKGKKQHDRREAIKSREAVREVERAIKERK
jgi:SsrA-binding protein